MDVSDSDPDDIWDYKPLKRRKKRVVVCSSTSTSIKSLPTVVDHQRPSFDKNLKSHDFQYSTTINDDSSSSLSFTNVTTQKESGKNEVVKKNIPLSSSSIPQQHKSKGGGRPSSSSTISNESQAKKKAKTKLFRHRKISTNESSDSLGKTPKGAAESTETNNPELLTYCPVCQISSAIFRNRQNNIQRSLSLINHIADCLDKKIPEDLKECPHGINCAVQEEEHYRNFQHHSLARLRASLSPKSNKTSSQGEIKFSMTEEFLKERNNAGNLGSLPIPQDVPIGREVKSETSNCTLQGVRIESDSKMSDIEDFKRLFSNETFKTPKKLSAKSPAKSTPKKSTAKSPAKLTPKKKNIHKSPLVKDSGQQTLMYDMNKKDLVLTPNKSPLRISKPLSSPMHTPTKQVSSSMWESLSIRKPCPPESNSSLLSALNKSDSESMSSPSLQKHKSRCPFAIGDDNSKSVNSDSLPSPTIMPSKNQPSSSFSCKSLGKAKSDKSYVTVLFLSDSEDDGDSKKEKADSKSAGIFPDSEGNSSATEPANDLDFSVPSSDQSFSPRNSSVDSIEKAGKTVAHNTYRTHSQTVVAESDDELDISEATESEKTPKNTAELKTKLDKSNILSSNSNQSLPVLKSKYTPSKVEFHKLRLFSPSKPNMRKQLSSKANSADSVSNQMQLTSFFIRKTNDDKLSTAPNVKSEETNVEPIVLSKNTDQKNPLSDIEKNPKPVMNLDQFKNMFKKKPSKKLAISAVPELKPARSAISVPESELDHSARPDKKYLPSCPFYKKIPDTAITVDAFKYGVIPGCRAYFLSHFHYDHYQGLKKSFKQPIYCSEVTANLVKLKIGVLSQYVHPLPLYWPVTIDDVDVTLLDANHCPGATLFLLKRKDGKVILHTGDFRADSVMEDYAALRNVKIHQLYLDTTYCDSSYAFPGQEKVLELSVSLSMAALQENSKTLIVVGTYTIGKEKVFLAIAEAIKSRIGVTKEKKRILDCQNNSRLDKLVSLDLKECGIHVVKMNCLNYKSLSEHLARYKNKFDRILAFKPTGWTHSNQNESLSDIKPTFKRDDVILYGLPYSEHSSFTEMKRFVQFIRPENIIPTVNNGSPSARKAMDDIFKSWMSEKTMPINTFFRLSQRN